MINIMLVDDHAVVREGYRSLLQKQTGLTVIAEASTGEEAYLLYQTHQPNITIMDISLPGQSGLETLSHIKQYDPTAKILVFSMHLNPSIATQAMNAGAHGFVTKSSDPEVLIHAIHQVQRGIKTFSPDIAQAIALEKAGNDTSNLDQLTIREFEILMLLVAAKSSNEIAETLNISPKTVANSHYIIKRKLDVNSDIELTHLAIKMKLV